MSGWVEVILEEVTSESTTRWGKASSDNRPVYGVDRHVGLTAEAKYQATDLSRYKMLDAGMFAYNPMRLNIGSIGYCSHEHEPGLVSPDYIVFRCDESHLLPDYLHYYIQGPDWAAWTAGAGVGSVRSRIYYRELKGLRLSLPPIGEQREIVAGLRAFDDKLLGNRRLNETLEGMASALFQSWFVDFDPVRAKAESRPPVGMDAAMAALFPERFEDSALGEVPQGWAISEIGAEVEVVGGSTPSTSEAMYWDGGTIYWVTPKDLSDLQAPILLNTSRQITDAGLQQISSGLLPIGTVLLSSRAPIGYLAMAEIPVAINQGFIAMKCSSRLPNTYVLNWAKTNMDVIKGRANGTTFMEVSKANFRTIPVVVPSPEILQVFQQLGATWYEKIATNLRESQTLAELRDTLLPKMLSRKYIRFRAK